MSIVLMFEEIVSESCMGKAAGPSERNTEMIAVVNLELRLW